MKKMKNSILSILTATLILSVLSFSTNSCRKEEPTIAKIIVRDTANVLVPGARVILFGKSTTTPPQPVTRIDTLFTNSAGVAIFDYTDDFQLGSAGFTVLNIDASKDSLSGTGVIKIDDEEETVETVFIDL